ncbi:hypothetical protein CHS0354_001311 [Potamilus streckersoni]|uniref:Uncharacterized protein n=1 Tax=Potamilus streckersoni TaxID=2493646 RepID=A0AAE0RV07_9BIVA|nr:hypothetical protein CHS0354_001311 [Potamilus streckersoni]
MFHCISAKCYKPNSNNSTAVEVDQRDLGAGTNRLLEVAGIEIDPTTNYWTIEADKTGGLHSIIDENGASASLSLELRSCSIKENMLQENLESICLQPDEDAYIHPI